MAATTGEPLRLVLLGKTGVGKSHVANVILGREAFESAPSASSVTQKCQKVERSEGRSIEVVDTPGVIDTDRDEKEIASEILHSIHMSRPGPHAFLLVIQTGRFSDEELRAVKALQKIFGEKVKDYTVLVFNRVQELRGKSLDVFVKGSKRLKNVVQDCGERYVPIDDNIRNRSQVTNLLRQVDKLIKDNGGKHFSNDVYRQSIGEASADTFVARMLTSMVTWVGHFYQVLLDK